MSTFIIKQYGSTIFNRICHSPPSEEDIILILAILKEYNFKILKCNVEIIQGNNYKKNVGAFDNIDEFFNFFKNLCKEGIIKYGVVVYLDY